MAPLNASNVKQRCVFVCPTETRATVAPECRPRRPRLETHRGKPFPLSFRRSPAKMALGKPAGARKPRPVEPSEIQKLQEQADSFTRKIEIEKRRCAELTRQIQQMREQIADQRRKMGGLDAATEGNQKVQRQIKILENRLDKALAKYNEALAHNKQLRLTIDDLRKERLVFDDIYKKLQVELEEKKREMGDIIEVSNKAFEARDRAVNEMARLKNQANKEQAAFEAEFSELGKQIEHDRRMKEFMKNRRRDDSEAEALGAAAAEEEKMNKKKAIAGQWGIAKEKVSQNIVKERVQSYGEAFQSITDATGISDVDELVTVFVEAEDENFRLFSYVNQLNQEIEKLDEQIADIRAEIERYKGEGSAKDAKRKKILKDLETRLKKTEDKVRLYDGKYKAATETVTILKEGIWKIYNKIGCNTPVNREMLGDEGVTDANMMQYLGVIEQRTNEILQMFAASRAAARGETLANTSYKSLLAAGPETAAVSTTLQIEPPSTEKVADADEDSEDEDDGDRPLGREELRAKTAKLLAKREAAAAQRRVAGGKGGIGPRAGRK